MKQPVLVIREVYCRAAGPDPQVLARLAKAWLQAVARQVQP